MSDDLEHLYSRAWYAPHQAWLSGRGLPHHDPRGAKPGRANLARATLTRAILRDAILRDAILMLADLRDAILIDTDLRDANLTEVYLTERQIASLRYPLTTHQLAAMSQEAA